MLPDWLDWLPYLAGSSKSHCEISIFCIFLQCPHQVDMKNVYKSRKDFLLYFTTLETYRAQSALKLAPIFKILTSCDNGEGLFVRSFVIFWRSGLAKIHSGVPIYLLENDDVITQQKRNTQMGPMNDEMVVCK